MDLYADLPLAKGAKASSALNADGKLTTSLSSTSSVWASTPLMVPQAAKNKSNYNSNKRSMAGATSSTSMLPSALATGRGKSPTRLAISLDFKPTVVARRASAASQVLCKEEKQEKVRSIDTGLGYVAATEVKVTSVQQQQQQRREKEREEVDVGVGAAGGHFFQATYRDEYQPARPNSYEVYCKERQEKKKLEQVKRELSRRQKEQEREGKLEREKLAKDLAEGRAPAMKLPVSAGRGRGMTMPAWMRKKIGENVASQPESERDVDRERESNSKKADTSSSEGQFEDAAEPRDGLAYSSRGIGFSSSLEPSPSAVPDGISRAAITEPNLGPLQSSVGGSDRNIKGRRSTEPRQSNAPAMDEFGREIRHETKRKSDDESVEKRGERKTSSRSYNVHDSERHQGHESRAFDEKRHRSNEWDSRSSYKTPLTSHVVLLQNMVGPGEVDDELQDEVKSECFEKYGPVTKCVIYEVTGRVPSEEAVRIFVQFTNVEDATKGKVEAAQKLSTQALAAPNLASADKHMIALTGLHGRYFGGRKVKAVYYNESMFERMELTSQ